MKVRVWIYCALSVLLALPAAAQAATYDFAVSGERGGGALTELGNKRSLKLGYQITNAKRTNKKFNKRVQIHFSICRQKKDVKSCKFVQEKRVFVHGGLRLTQKESFAMSSISTNQLPPGIKRFFVRIQFDPRNQHTDEDRRGNTAWVEVKFRKKYSAVVRTLDFAQRPQRHQLAPGAVFQLKANLLGASNAPPVTNMTVWWRLCQGAKRCTNLGRQIVRSTRGKSTTVTSIKLTIPNNYNKALGIPRLVMSSTNGFRDKMLRGFRISDATIVGNDIVMGPLRRRYKGTLKAGQKVSLTGSVRWDAGAALQRNTVVKMELCDARAKSRRACKSLGQVKVQIATMSTKTFRYNFVVPRGTSNGLKAIRATVVVPKDVKGADSEASNNTTSLQVHVGRIN